MSTTYSGTYAADKVLSGGLSISGRGVGQWWESVFNGGSYSVSFVRIRNRIDCCGARLGGTRVMIGDQECGRVPNGPKNGQWYAVQCKEPIRGNRIRLITTQNTWLQINGIEVYGISTEEALEKEVAEFKPPSPK